MACDEQVSEWAAWEEQCLFPHPRYPCFRPHVFCISTGSSCLVVICCVLAFCGCQRAFCFF